VLAIGACATSPKESEKNGEMVEQLDEVAEDINVQAMSEPGGSLGVFQSTPRPEEKTTILPGTGQFIDKDAAVKPAPVTQQDGQVTLNFEDAGIGEVVKVIFDILQENYVLDPRVQGSVTVQTGRPLPRDMLIPTLELLLRMNNAALVNTDGVYKIVPATDAIPGNVSPRLENQQQDAGYGVRIFPLRYVSAAEMETILQPFIPEGGILYVDAARNMLLVSGTVQELAVAQETIDIFDVNWLEGMSIGMYRLQNMESDAIVAELNNLFGESSQLPLAGLFRFISLTQINAILVVTPQAEYLREAGEWIERLDSAGGERLYVYEVQNGEAEYLASVLSEVFGIEGGGAPPPATGGRVAPGREPAELTSPTSGLGTPGRSTQPSPRPQSMASPESEEQPTVGAQQVTLENVPERPQGAAPFGGIPSSEEVRVVPDPENNTLLIWSSGFTYEKILSALRKLDITPRQVLVEVTIAEVSLSGRLRFGVRWFFKNDIPNSSKQGTGSLGVGGTNISLNAALNAAISGPTSFVYALTDADNVVRVLLDALEQETQVNILSSPQILVVDNQEGRIRVGDQQPVQSSTTVTEGGNTLSSIEYKDTGVLLTVAPQINAGGLISMDVNQEVIDVGEIDAATGQRAFLQRSVSSKVVVQSGQTIVMGGLISESRRGASGGIPYLYKVPIVGPLFGTTEKDAERRELLVLITPRVVRDNLEALRMTEELKLKMKQVVPIIDYHYKPLEDAADAEEIDY
jgi:general secretion pathway protein D